MNEANVAPIDAQQQAEVLEATRQWLQQAGIFYQREFLEPAVLFDLSGTTAGMVRWHDRSCSIRYNPWIFGKYFAENMSGTVPHEVAHYAVYAVYGWGRVKPHGPQWRELMAFFGADPAVTFDRDLSGVPQRRQRSHSYRCACSAHSLSTTRHNRVQRRRARYQCRRCGDVLRYQTASGLVVD